MQVMKDIPRKTQGRVAWSSSSRTDIAIEELQLALTVLLDVVVRIKIGILKRLVAENSNVPSEWKQLHPSATDH